jgi:voltage-gated sodium channel
LLPPLASLAILTTLILFRYGMVGWQLCGETIPRTGGRSARDADARELPALQDAGMPVHSWSWIFFVSFILVAAFIVINVLIGIVLNSLVEARELKRRESLEPDEAVPVLERIQYLRAALDQLEGELKSPRTAALA